MWYGSISRFDPLILYQLDAYAWFEEAEHVMFLKLESWKKAYIFKWDSIFEGGRLQKLEILLALRRILPKPSEVKNFSRIQMKKTPLFIEFSCKELGPSWYMDQTYRFNHMGLDHN